MTRDRSSSPFPEGAKATPADEWIKTREQEVARSEVLRAIEELNRKVIHARSKGLEVRLDMLGSEGVRVVYVGVPTDAS